MAVSSPPPVLRPGLKAGFRRPTGARFSPWRRSLNTMRTAALLGALGAMLVWIGSAIADGPTGTAIGLAFGMAAVAGSYWFSDRLALRLAGARPLHRGELPRLHRTVHELSARAGLPVPRLYVSPAMQPNAFATGRNADHAAICVTRGLLDALDGDELRAVLAHELAHIGNRDILVTSLAAAFATGISALADLLLWMPLFATDDDAQPSPIGLLVAALLAPLAAGLLQLAVSRAREYDADDTGAQLIGDGTPLARALLKIDAAAHRQPMAVDPAQATAYIVNPLTGRRVRFAALFSTHPPTEQRVARLLADHDPWRQPPMTAG